MKKYKVSGGPTVVKHSDIGVSTFNQARTFEKLNEWAK